ncbi:Heat stress transcription factor A-1a [Phytophthora ramorum]|nr:Heat stress transcription factor A-1a [Phytophthora ramorum]
MLQDESDAVLRWTPDGRAFEIHDMHEMMARVLPKYFKHCKYTSFQRQLNYFSFRKWTKSKAVVCTFSNDFFLRDQPELAWRITRKKSLSPHALPKYRPRAVAQVAPYWKKEPTADSAYLPLSGGRLPSMDGDLMLKQQQQPRRYCSFNMAAPVESYARSYDLSSGNGAVGPEPFDWIDCLLPPADDAYMYMYPPPVAVAPYTMNPMSSRKCFAEFVPSTSL